MLLRLPTAEVGAQRLLYPIHNAHPQTAAALGRSCNSELPHCYFWLRLWPVPADPSCSVSLPNVDASNCFAATILNSLLGDLPGYVLLQATPVSYTHLTLPTKA